MGEVTARKRGKKWEWRFEGAPINGKRVQNSKGGFATKKEALEAGHLAKVEYDRTGITFKPSEISYSDFLDKWLDEYGSLELNLNTKESYQKKIKLHIKPALGKYRISSLNYEIIHNFIKDLFNKGYSLNTISVIKSIISNSLNYAVFPLKYLSINPALGVRMPSKNSVPDIPTRKKQRVIIPEDKIELIFNRFPEGSTAYIPLSFAYLCGMRHGETFAVDIDNDIDFDNKILNLKHQLQYLDKHWTLVPPKYNSVRNIDLSTKMINILKNELKNQKKNKELYGDYYKQLKVNSKGQLNYTEGKNIRLATMRENGEFISPRIIQHVSRVIHYEKGIEYSDFDFHSLRHTHATLLLANGANIKYVQKRLGHKNIKETLDIYYQLTNEMRQNNQKFIEML